MESNLKTQFPLSPRKFWKKMIEKAFTIGLVAVSVFALVWVGHLAAIDTAGDTSPVLVSFISALIAFLIPAGIYGLYVHFYIRMYYYSDDNEFLTIKKGVFAPTEIHVQYMKIQDVYVDQDILDRIMGLYDVHISSATYTSGIEAHIDGVEKKEADGLKHLLLGKIKGSSTSHHTTVAADAPAHVDAQHSTHKVHFSSPISSDVYGLSGNWWTSEIIKIFTGAIVTPLVISIWIYFQILDDGGFAPEDIGMMALIWIAIFVVFVVFRAGYLFLWKLHYKYDFGEEYIYIKEGVLSVSEKNMGYNTIQDVQIRQSFIDRIFGVADVVIENASPSSYTPHTGRHAAASSHGIVIEGLGVADARKVSDELKKVILSKRTHTKGV